MARAPPRPRPQAVCWAFGGEGFYWCKLGPLAKAGPTWWKVGGDGQWWGAGCRAAAAVLLSRLSVPAGFLCRFRRCRAQPPASSFACLLSPLLAFLRLSSSYPLR